MRSQRHLLDTRGIDSKGNTKPLAKYVNNLSEIVNGAPVGAATVDFYGRYVTGQIVTVNITHNSTTGNVYMVPVPAGDPWTGEEAASAFVTAVSSDATFGTLVTATAKANVVHLTPATTTNGDKVTINSVTY